MRPALHCFRAALEQSRHIMKIESIQYWRKRWWRRVEEEKELKEDDKQKRETERE